MKISGNIKKILKKTFIIILIVGLGAYVSWDISKKVIEKLRDQGRKATIMEIITFSENENCEPFSVSLDEKQVNLININCLQEISEESFIEEFDSSDILETEK